MSQALQRGIVAVGLGLPLILSAGSLRAAISEAVRTLRAGGSVYLGQAPALTSATLYSGDQVRTEEGQAAVSLLRGDLLMFGRKSRASFQRSSDGFSVQLERGQLSLNATSPQLIRVETDGLTLTRLCSFPSLAEVALEPDGSVVLAVHKGTVQVANLRPEPVLVNADKILTVSSRLARAEPQSVGTGAHGKMTLGEKLRTFHIGHLNHAASTILLLGIVGGAAATAIAAPLATGEAASPSAQ